MTHDASNKSSSDIEREVESTRAGLETTLGELRERVQPRAVVDEIWEFASGSGGGEFARNLGRSVKDNPIPVALIGAGIAWLISGKGTPSLGRSSYSSVDYDEDDYYSGARRFGSSPSYYRDDTVSTPYSRSDFEAEGYERFQNKEPGLMDKARSGLKGAGESLSNAAKSAADAVSGAASSVSGAVSDAASSVSDSVSSAGDRVSGSTSRLSERASYYGDRASEQAHHLRDRASHLGDQAYRTGRQATRRAGEIADQQPLLVAAFGLAIGAIIGASFRSTPTERRLVGEQADRVKEQAAQLAQQGYERAAEAVSNTYQEVKGEAQAQGFTTSDAKDAAGSLGDRVRAVYEKGKETLTEEVKSTASEAEKKADDASGKLASDINKPQDSSPKPYTSI
ncbi:DUF3618 domain-containing protein [Terrihabitans sp. B22-R8]|uniref:DUF3618 domain-containing protein n=1 Tax=Terrihabitans sp. B22-R8 TaxID=3425128 RepID=UPI00403C5830